MLRVLAAAASIAVAAAFPAVAQQADCPNGGTVRFGVEPYEAAAKLVPIYQHIGDLIGQKFGCKVEVLITTSYNAEIEAMRAGKLEVGEFGPLGYVLAHQVAGAQAVATFSDKSGKPATYTAGIVTWPGSGITTLKEIEGHTFAYSDPASTSGHLFPAMALTHAGINADTGIKPLYAGSHGASFEAIRNDGRLIGAQVFEDASLIASLTAFSTSTWRMKSGSSPLLIRSVSRDIGRVVNRAPDRVGIDA